MRYVALMLVVAGGLGLLTGVAGAADPKWQVSAGYSGVVREGAWTPLFVTLTNDGDARTGRVVANLAVPGIANRTLPYITEVELPQHSKKRYAIYLPYPDVDSVRLDLSGYRAQLPAPRMDQAKPGDLVVCVVGGDGGFLSFLNGRTGMGVAAGSRAAPQNNPYGGPQPISVQSVEAAVGRLDWSGLPDSWLGWDGASVVVLADTSLSSASPAALEALRTWVQCGGTLLVPGGAQAPALASSPFASLLPGAIVGTTTLPDLSPLRAWVGSPLESQPALAAQLTLPAETEVVCGTRTQPLVVSRSFGAGRVLMTTFDYTAAPVKYYEALWPKLLSYRGSAYHLARDAEGGNPYNSATDSLTEAVTTMPQAELPSIWLIVGFLVAYIVVLVPVNYTVLNRLDRRELAWVTTPAIVLLFSFGAYGLGYGMRGGAVLLNRISIIEAGAGSPVGRGVGYAAIFSPSRTGYQLAIDAPSAGPRDLSAATDQHLRQGASFYTAPQPRVADVNMNMWTTRAFAVDYRADLGRGVSGYLEYDGATLRAQVRNDTGGSLIGCRIVRTRSQGKSKDLRPGQSATLEFIANRAAALPSFPSGQYSGVTPDLTGMATAALFLNAPYLPQTQETLPVLVARLDRPAPLALAGIHPRTKDVSLLIVHLPVRLVRGRQLQVPEWLVASRYVESSGSISGGDPYSGAQDTLILEHGGLTIEYALPFAGVSATAQGLELACASGLPTADIFAYDYTRRSWQPIMKGAFAAAAGNGTGPRPGRGGRMLRGGSGGGPGGGPATTLALPHPQDFLSPEGRVLVKVGVPSGSAQLGPLTLRATVQTQ